MLTVMPDTVAVGRTPIAAREIQRPQAAFAGVNGKIELPEDADRHTCVVFRGDLHQQVSVRPAIKAYQPTFACARTRRSILLRNGIIHLCRYPLRASQSKVDAQACVVRCTRLAKRLERFLRWLTWEDPVWMTCMRTRRTVELTRVPATTCEAGHSPRFDTIGSAWPRNAFPSVSSNVRPPVDRVGQGAGGLSMGSAAKASEELSSSYMRIFARGGVVPCSPAGGAPGA